MFAPQTLRLRVPQQLENKQMFIYFQKFRVELTLPRTLIPVCRLFCAADSFLSNFGVRLFVSDVWVGQRPVLSITLYTSQVNIFRRLKSHESLPSQR